MTATPRSRPTVDARPEPGEAPAAASSDEQPSTDDDGTPPEDQVQAQTQDQRQRRKPKGDVHIGTMAGDVHRVPGSGTPNGEKAIADYMRSVLDRVRRSIRERANAARRQPPASRPTD